jgi:protein-disulfide isomerase
MSKSTAIVGMLVAFGVGYFVGGVIQTGGKESPLAVIPNAAQPDPNTERYAVPTGSGPHKGGDRAKVTIIQYSDFQCPFCSRVEPTIDQILKTYGKDVRVFWKNNPLPFHQNAGPAAELASAAAEKGKFWELHDLMFKNQQQLDRPALEKYAKEVGLDDGKIKEALDQTKWAAQIKADQDEAAKFGARGTPAFFINGRPLSGAQPFDAFKKVIDEELAAADKAIKAGVSATQVYDALTRNAKTAAAAPPQQPQQPRPAEADPNTVYKLPVGNSPVKGSANAKVTIIQFSDFQCPFCSRVEPTLTDLEKDYGKDVRVVWKNNPLPFHPNAMPAAEAAMAAAEQGKFWEMHAKLFGDQQHLDPQTYEKYATELGLNMGRYKAAIEGHKFQQQIKDDQALAEKFGARGTPSFFINGHPLRGAQPKEAFKQVIDKEIENANAMIKKGVKPSELYTELMKNAKDKVEAGPAPAQPQRPGEPDQNTVYKALVGDAPIKGPKTAKVTIVEFSDFQCPFCGRVEPTVTKILEAYPKDVRVAFKQLPLPFHNNAHAAAEAALAAKAQGKFWEMHAKMFGNQQALDRPSLEKYAQEIGLDVGKFKSDLDSGKWKQKVDAELAEGNKIGARGTPSFFINGKPFVGAQPFEAFKAKVDSELAVADALIKKGTPVAHVYDELMKTAKTEVAAAPAAPPGGGAPPADTTVYKVDPGSAPVMGPKDAPVTIVEFSDFQCPFCSRVVPTVKQIEDKYRGKVRVAFRNYPLPFHDKAQLAAEAAMAAKAQGKFWEMHDKMFGNQQALDRPALEKYAQEIGLDIGKFKSDLDSGKYKSDVQADVTYANTLGGGMGTPTFFINGRKVAGAMPFDSFASIIDEELKKKGK